MATKVKEKSVQVEQELDFQRREWTAERIGWFLMAVIVLLSMLGLFGDGLASQATRIAPDGFEFTYERFTRNTSSSEILVKMPANLTQEGKASFWMDQKYLEGIQIDDISPEPESTVVDNGRTTYTFDAGEGTPPVEVKFDLTTERSGLRKGTVGWENGQPMEFNQIVFP